MTITWQTLISVAAIIAAIIALWGYLTKVVHFMDRQKKSRTPWVDEAYRTVTFETPPTGELLTWLQANAVKQ